MSWTCNLPSQKWQPTIRDMALCRSVLLSAFVFVALLSGVGARAQMQPVGDGGPGPVKAQHLTAELVSAGPSIAPGGTLQVGLVLTLEEKWHVYWLNAGDSGEPPHITWTMPDGVTAGPMQFPVPSRLPLGPLMDFGYEDVGAFPVLLTASSKAKPGPIHLDANVRWLVCREVCIPGKAHLGLDLKVAPGAPAPAALVGALGAALNTLPKPLPTKMKLTVNGGKSDFVLTLVTGDAETDAEFYPFDQDLIDNAADQEVEPVAGGVRLRVKRAAELTKLPKELHGVLKLSGEQGYDVTAQVVPGEIAPASGGTKPATSTDGVTAVGAIGLALVGGIILNLMPCVFPVLFLKGLALVQSSSEERGRLRAHGLVYTLGILVSFWLIVAVLLGLRSTSNQIGWGFQLQSPTFLVVLALGLFFFSLSLAGQFDLGLSMTNAGDSLTRKQGFTGSFFTGVLATVVATPCTAPLMGAAIGFALAQPAWITFAVFTALGLGLALPYLLLSANPAWTRVLPRPGAWMETLKQLTAVPLFLTVIWLTWVYGRLYSGSSAASTGGLAVDHLAKLMIGFLLVAVAGWALAKWPARWGSVGVAVVLGVAALGVTLYQPKDTLLTWAPYTPETLAAARAAGHPVFIDFTAAWCLSCQVNERLVLRSKDVQEKFSAGKVTLLKADWTQYDAGITKELADVGRSGVPTYVLYPGTANAEADVLPEVLTKGIVLDALKKDLKN